MARTVVTIESPAELSAFVTHKLEVCKVSEMLLSIALNQSEILDVVKNKLGRNWGSLSELPQLAPLWVQSTEIEERCKVKAKSFGPVEWGTFLQESKVKTQNLIKAFIEVLNALTFESVSELANRPKATKTRTRAVATITIGDAAYTVAQLFTDVPEFLLAFASKEALDAFYAEHNATHEFKVAVFAHLSNVAFAKNERTKYTVADLETMLAKNQDTAGKDLTDETRAALVARIEKLKAKANAKAKTEPESEPID